MKTILMMVIYFTQTELYKTMHCTIIKTFRTIKIVRKKKKRTQRKRKTLMKNQTLVCQDI